MTASIYTKLRNQIDQYSVGFPEAKSGVDLKILEKLYTEEEAALFLDLSMALEPPDSIAGRTQKRIDLQKAQREGGLFRGHPFCDRLF